MIHSKDRSGWFGASDTSFVIGNYNTKTFRNWWFQKLGFIQSSFTTPALMAGTMYEHKILSALNIKSMEFDKQIYIEELKLRVNLDGNTQDTIYECKTFNKPPFKPSKKYLQQVYVQMYATGLRKAYIAAYRLTEEHYRNYFLDIEKEKIQLFEVKYDEDFINKIYLPKLIYLRDCLIEGKMPI